MRNTHIYPITKQEVIETLEREQEKYMLPDSPIGGTQAMCLGIAITLIRQSNFINGNSTPVDTIE